MPLLSLFVLLLASSVGLDALTSLLGVNDTFSVAARVASLSALGVAALPILAFSAAAEELFFRGLIQGRLGMLPSVFLFGLAHAGYGSIVQFAGALIAGTILSFGRKETRSVFPGMGAHFLYNVVAVFVIGGIA